MTRPDSNKHDVSDDGDGDCNGYGWDYGLFDDADGAEQ